VIIKTEQDLDALIAEIQNPQHRHVMITEADRQMIMLGLSRLAMERPGWNFCIGEIAKKFDGEAMLLEFKRTYLPGKLPVPVPESDCTEEIKDGLCAYADQTF
jgi:hypothetical protein